MYYHLKYLLLFLLIISMGCDKDPSSNQIPLEFYFKFNVDGQLTEYVFRKNDQTNLTGSLISDVDSGSSTLQIYGSSDLLNPGKNTLSIFISTDSEILLNAAYSNVESPGVRIPSSLFIMGYYNSDGEVFTAALNNTGVPLYEQAVVEIASITETSISGTFSGLLKQYDVSGGTLNLIGQVVISEGQFAVPRF